MYSPFYYFYHSWGDSFNVNISIVDVDTPIVDIAGVVCQQ